ncbi:MAG: polysaccharide biosynthesis protein [Gammaproteobacteria bacterium]
MFLHYLRSRTFAFAHDFLMIPVAWLGAYWVRFNMGVVPLTYIDQAIQILPVVATMQAGVFWYFGLYRGIWRFASMPDLVRIAKAVLVGVSICALVIFAVDRMQYVPRSVLPMHAMLLFFLLSAPRCLYRWIKDNRLMPERGNRVLIVGSGDAAEMLIRDLMRHPDRVYQPAALVDDKPEKAGREIHGIRVLGKVADIPAIVKEQSIDLIIIAIPSIAARDMRRLVAICEQTHIPFRTLPPLHDLVTGKATVNEVREVSIEDLLGRDAVSLEQARLRAEVAGKIVLVSGGGGSIGAELCRQVARLSPARLIIIDHSEFSLFEIERELGGDFPTLPVTAIAGDVCDEALLEHLLKGQGTDVVFHAAAYKHVPMLESQLRQAVKNNILGTLVMAKAAARLGCRSFVLISTDKAVNPANVMGATKRVAELLCQHMQKRSATRFITVRFGNVLGSAGSVVPLFKEQIALGGPVTVTDPEIARYFMTIPEATQLIMQASAMGKGGEIFVLDMGEPVKIRYLAEQMIRLSGKRPGQDIAIVYTGLRPGEKRHEELFYENERPLPTEHEKIFLARPRAANLERMPVYLERFKRGVDAFDEASLLACLRELVPDLMLHDVHVPVTNVVPIERRRH